MGMSRLWSRKKADVERKEGTCRDRARKEGFQLHLLLTCVYLPRPLACSACFPLPSLCEEENPLID